MLLDNSKIKKTAATLINISIIINLLFPIFGSYAKAQVPSINLHGNSYVLGEVIVKYKEEKVQIESKSVLNQARLNSVEGNLEKKHEFKDLNAVVYKSKTKTTAQLIQELSANPNVEYAEPNHIAHVFADEAGTGEPDDPTDTYFDNQWGLDNDGQSGGTIGADTQAKSAWELIEATGTGTEIMIGVIDTGIDYTHPDLRENMWYNPLELAAVDDDLDGEITYSEVINHLNNCDGVSGITLKDLFCSATLSDGIDNDGNGYVDDFVGWNAINNTNDPFDDHTATHGTHVAGIIGAKRNNSLGISGINAQAKLVAIKTFDSSGSGSFGDIVNGITYSDSLGIKITNNSYGSTADTDYRNDQENVSFVYGFLRNSMKNSGLNNGTLFIVASGNGRTSEDTTGFNIDTDPNDTSYPAAYDLDNILTVASTYRDDTISVFSNFGQTSVDIGAPGSEIYSTLGGNTYGFKSGTSMATPMVAGTTTLVYKYLEYLNGTPPTYAELKAQILNHSEYITGLDSYLSPDIDDVHGKRLNIYDVLPPEAEYTLNPEQIAGDIADGGSITLNLTGTKAGKLNLASDPNTYSKIQSATLNRNGLYELEFEDVGRNIFQADINVNWILNTSIDDRHDPVIFTGNRESFEISGGCYGNTNDVELTVDDSIDDPITLPIVESSIQCNNGFWTVTLDLSSLNNSTLTFTPTQPTTQSYPKDIIKTEILPVDPIITSPIDDFTTTSSSVTVIGTGEPLAAITITGGSAVATTNVTAEGVFQVNVPLNLRQSNTLVASSIDQYDVPSENTDSVIVIQQKKSSSSGGGGSASDDLVVTPTTFSDIAGNAFETYITNLVTAGVVSGYSDGTYKPDENVTREQMAKFIVKAFDFETETSIKSYFPDIDPDSKFIIEINTLQALGIVNGYGNGTYGPSKSVSRGEVTKFVALSFHQKRINISGELPNIFPDLADDNPFAYYINYLAQNNVGDTPIISGFSDGTYGSDLPLTRGQMAKIIWNSMEFVELKLSSSD
ncbi:S8 family serine peptidase [Candidatus Dojkabacteria bacterium]|nr:S8 family serine peptidase [Candidatus Dojkabacteria bacterium]